MITPPRRSVTRFFIPLIDVLILLFCIFLLLPFVSSPAQSESTSKDEADAAAVAAPTSIDQLREERDEAIRRLERFRREQTGRLQFRSLDIDPTTGLLVETVGDEQRLMPQALVKPRRENRLPNTKEQADAAEEMKEWVKLQKRRAAEQEKELFVVLRLPKTPSAYPSKADLRYHELWFENPNHFGYELP